MNQPATNKIDPAWIATVVREVIAQINQHNSPTNLEANIKTNPLPEKVVSVATIDSLPGSPSEIVIAAKAVVTPAAHDEARLRGITIRRSDAQTQIQTEIPNPGPEQSTQQRTQPNEILDVSKPERAASMLAQLARRGITTIGCKIVLSETPAIDVFRLCHNEKQRAVLLCNISDVQRFASELPVDVWVLDMKRMNLMTAVNAAVQISQKRRVAQKS
jgi:hypothetical protein